MTKLSNQERMEQLDMGRGCLEAAEYIMKNKEFLLNIPTPEELLDHLQLKFTTMAREHRLAAKMDEIKCQGSDD